MKAAAERAFAQHAKVKAADTAENEARLVAELNKHGVLVSRLKKSSPYRYRVKNPDGSSFEPASLLDLEGLLDKITNRNSQPARMRGDEAD